MQQLLKKNIWNKIKLAQKKGKKCKIKNKLNNNNQKINIRKIQCRNQLKWTYRRLLKRIQSNDQKKEL